MSRVWPLLTGQSIGQGGASRCSRSPLRLSSTLSTSHCTLHRVSDFFFSFKWTVPLKYDQIFKKMFFVYNEVSTSSGCSCGILQLYEVCKGGLGGVERHYNPSLIKKCLQQNRSPVKFQFATSKETNSHIF